MKLSTLVLATAVIAAPTFAFAQSAPSPNNQSGPGVNSSTTTEPTAQGTVSETGNTKGQPSRATTGAAPMDKGAKGTGMKPASPATDSMKKNESPASQGTGISKEK